jgi:hypothetical protein
MRSFTLRALFFAAGVNAANVAITSDQVAVVALGTSLVSRQLPDGDELLFEPSTVQVAGFDDVTNDPSDPSTIYALSTEDSTVCRFIIQDDAALSPLDCVFVFDDVKAYSGISASNGTVVMSGGSKGFTVFDFTGARPFNDSGIFINVQLPNVVGQYDVLMITPTLAAFSTNFGDSAAGNSSFGTMIVDLSGDEAQERYNFRVDLSLQFTFAIEPSNFALENALYETPCGTSFLYTANGALTIQETFKSNSTKEIVIPNFRAVTSAVNQELGLLVLGGADDDAIFQIQVHSLLDPHSPSLLESFEGVGRVTSVASAGNVVAYTTVNADGASYNLTTLASNTTVPQCSAAPSQAPSESLSPSQEPSAIPSQAPSESSSPTQAPTVAKVLTLAPTKQPVTLSPNQEPSAIPSQAPSESSSPTQAPTVTKVPTLAPTKQPVTMSPTVFVGANVTSGSVVLANSTFVIAGKGLAGIISRKFPDGEEKLRSPNIFGGFVNGFEDVAVDPMDPTTVLALSNEESAVCIFKVADDATLRPGNCIALSEPFTPYCGMSVFNETLVISGGENGFAVYKYDGSIPEINNATFLGVKLPGAVGFYDVTLVTSTLAAFSTAFEDFSDGVGHYGTMMVNLEGPGPEELYSFRLQENFTLPDGIGHSNFPLVNSVYETPSGEVFMYTAHGVLAIQEPYKEDTPSEVSIDFQVLTGTVNQELGMLFLGGETEGGYSTINGYSLTDPNNPELIYNVTFPGRISSIASTGIFFVYTSIYPDGMRYFYDEYTGPTPPKPTPGPSPTSAPTVESDETPRPTPGPSPASAPTAESNDTPKPTPEDEDDGLSGGAIAGIVIGSVFGAALLLAIAYCLLCREIDDEPKVETPETAVLA